LKFGTNPCPTYRIKCPNKMTEKSRTKVKRSVGTVQEDPIVKNIVIKRIFPISDGQMTETSEGYDNNFGPLLAADIRGQNMQVMLLDDGIDTNHADLKPNVNFDHILNFSGEQSISGR
ncbi:hypothetical protein Ciccas_012882, partial [Cichlidogyrus casuarinus]